MLPRLRRMNHRRRRLRPRRTHREARGPRAMLRGRVRRTRRARLQQPCSSRSLRPPQGNPLLRSLLRPDSPPARSPPPHHHPRGNPRQRSRPEHRQPPGNCQRLHPAAQHRLCTQLPVERCSIRRQPLSFGPPGVRLPLPLQAQDGHSRRRRVRNRSERASPMRPRCLPMPRRSQAPPPRGRSDQDPSRRTARERQPRRGYGNQRRGPITLLPPRSRRP